MSAMGMPDKFASPRECAHAWEPVSMVFETQLLDAEGRVRVRQPDLTEGRVYFICRGCASHTYMSTQWLGCRMYGSEDAIEAKDRDAGSNGMGRRAWSVDDRTPL